METTTTPATTTAEQPKAKPAPKARPKAKPAKAAPVASSNGRLKRTQLRVLEALSKGGWFSKDKIMSKVFNGNSVNLSPIVGATDPSERQAKEKKYGHPSLLTLGYVKQHVENIDGVQVVEYEITPKGAKAVANGAQDSRLPAPGSTITREYKGKTYKVKVLKVGFSYDGKEYTSLTAVAKAIIGSDSEINGFAFFKLKK